MGTNDLSVRTKISKSLPGFRKKDILHYFLKNLSFLCKFIFTFFQVCIPGKEPGTTRPRNGGGLLSVGMLLDFVVLLLLEQLKCYKNNYQDIFRLKLHDIIDTNFNLHFLNEVNV